MDDTKISWAHDTANPWWGCTKVSPACQHCYAEGLSARFHGDALWGPNAERRLRLDAFTSDLERIARRGEREGRPRRVFIASMGDIFEHRADLIEPRKRVWDVLHRLGRRITPMLLTKRPAIMAAWAQLHGWPEGAWAGTTVEDQQRADERVPDLLRVPAPVRFLSCEPLLGSVDLTRHGEVEQWTNGGIHPDGTEESWEESRIVLPGLHWIIVGGESGPKARPMHPAWARSLRDQCREAGVLFHFKQWGEWAPRSVSEMVDDSINYGRDSIRFAEHIPFDRWTGPTHSAWAVFRVGKKSAGRLLDGRTWDEVPDAR